MNRHKQWLALMAVVGFALAGTAPASASSLWQASGVSTSAGDNKEDAPDVPAPGRIAAALRLRHKLPRSAPPSVSAAVMKDGALQLTRQVIVLVPVTELFDVMVIRHVPVTEEVSVEINGRLEKRTRTVYRAINTTEKRTRTAFRSTTRLVQQTVPVKSIKSYVVTKAGKLEALDTARLLDLLKKPTPVLRGNSADVDPRHLELIKPGTIYLSIPPLQSLDIRGTGISAERMARLQGLAGARTLFPDRLTDAGLVHLRKLTGLQRLYLHDSPIAHAVLANLAGLTSLEELDLGHTHVTGVGLAHLNSCTRLHTLELDSTPVTDAGPAALAGLTNLETLSLAGTEVTGAGMAHLQGLTQLRELHLESTRITDAGLASLKGLTCLQSLNLSGTQVSDMGLVHLKGLTGLQHLDLGGTKATFAGARDLQTVLRNGTIQTKGLR